jgi:hypothetical protein
MQPVSKRALASRANGAKSQGPTSSAGKRRSSANSTRHGLLAKCVVLQNESENVFGQFFDEHLHKLNPADAIEYAVVEDMAAAAWRLRRICKVETTLFNSAIDRSTAPTEAGRTADAFSSLAATNQLQLLDRYESRLHRIYQRSLTTLRLLREVPEIQPFPEPNEPSLLPDDNFDVPPPQADAELDRLPNEPELELTHYSTNDITAPLEDPQEDPRGAEEFSQLDTEEETKESPADATVKSPEEPKQVDKVVRQAPPPVALNAAPTLSQQPNEPNNSGLTLVTRIRRL